MDPYLIAPGSTTTLAAVVVAEMVNLVESAILILPLLSGMTDTWDSEYVSGRGTVP